MQPSMPPGEQLWQIWYQSRADAPAAADPLRGRTAAGPGDPAGARHSRGTYVMFAGSAAALAASLQVRRQLPQRTACANERLHEECRPSENACLPREYHRPGLLKDLNAGIWGCILLGGGFCTAPLVIAAVAGAAGVARAAGEAAGVRLLRVCRGGAAECGAHCAPGVCQPVTWPEIPSHAKCSILSICQVLARMGGAGVPPAMAACHCPASGVCVVRQALQHTLQPM